MFAFQEQVVIVTGAAGNLGSAASSAFAAAGAHVVAVDRAPDRLAMLLPGLIGADHWLAGGVDLLDAAAVKNLAGQAVARWGRIDILINAVGGYASGQPVHETPIDFFDRMMSLNARTTYLTSQAVVPHMLAQGRGRIVNVASRAALAGAANAAAYAAAKAAVVRLTESMSAELKTSGINVNCVLPGTIDTPDNREAMPKADATRWVAVDALTDVILFLASDAARAVHGAAIPVYGLG